MSSNTPESDKMNNQRLPKLSVTDDRRLRYIGFDVGPEKVGELFRNSSEEKRFVDHVHEKRESHDVFRDTSNFREERVSQAERFTLIGACALILITFFLPFTPWVAGYVEKITDVTSTAVEITDPEPTADVSLTDVAEEAIAEKASAEVGEASEASETDVASATDPAAVEAEETEATEGTEGTEGTGTAATAPTKPRRTGFQSLEVAQTSKKIETTPYSWSGVQLIIGLGDFGSAVFSSGIIVILSAILFGLYMLLCFAIPGYVLYRLITDKGSPDDLALNLKSILRIGWIPVILWGVMLSLSLVGAEYGFETSDALKQIGESYSIGAFLGLLGSGFYLSIAGFVMMGAKSVEI